jgi:hypothetical protein
VEKMNLIVIRGAFPDMPFFPLHVDGTLSRQRVQLYLLYTFSIPREQNVFGKIFSSYLEIIKGLQFLPERFS